MDSEGRETTLIRGVRGSEWPEIVGRHQPRIYRYLLRIVGDHAEAEDLTQETFLRAHSRLGSLRDSGAITTWLYRIATTVSYDRFRRASARPKLAALDTVAPEAGLPVGWPDAAAPGVDEALEQREMAGCLRRHVDDLPETYREVILLHDLRGLRDRDIAERLGCSLETVKIRLHRARTQLRAVLGAVCDVGHDRRGSIVCEPKLARFSPSSRAHQPAT